MFCPNTSRRPSSPRSLASWTDGALPASLEVLKWDLITTSSSYEMIKTCVCVWVVIAHPSIKIPQDRSCPAWACPALECRSCLALCQLCKDLRPAWSSNRKWSISSKYLCYLMWFLLEWFSMNRWSLCTKLMTYLPLSMSISFLGNADVDKLQTPTFAVAAVSIATNASSAAAGTTTATAGRSPGASRVQRSDGWHASFAGDSGTASCTRHGTNCVNNEVKATTSAFLHFNVICILFIAEPGGTNDRDHRLVAAFDLLVFQPSQAYLCTYLCNSYTVNCSSTRVPTTIPNLNFLTWSNN